jgi:hypothetical protein
MTNKNCSAYCVQVFHQLAIFLPRAKKQQHYSIDFFNNAQHTTFFFKMSKKYAVLAKNAFRFLLLHLHKMLKFFSTHFLMSKDLQIMRRCGLEVV